LKNKKLIAYIIGFAIGDGNLSNPNGRAVRLRVTCDNKYPKIKENIKNSLGILLPKNKISEVKRDGCVDISCYSNTLEKILGWNAKGGSKEKQNVSIPNWILCNKIYLKECLRGLIQTDGSIYKDRGYIMVNYTTIIEKLALDYFESLKKLNYKPQIRKVTHKGHTKYIVRLSKDVKKFIEEINLWKE
jgi:DNA-binding transcriptional regulator WhiA